MIIFSIFLKNHIKYLNQILNLLKTNEIILSLTKCHFIYSNIIAFNHHIFKLKFNTMKKKSENDSKNNLFKKFARIKNRFKFFRILSKIRKKLYNHY